MRLDESVVQEVVNRIVSEQILTGTGINLESMREFFRDLDLVFKRNDSSQSVLVENSKEPKK